MDHAKHQTREEWLAEATELLRPWFDKVGAPIPRNVVASCGFPLGVRKGGKRTGHAIGQCFDASHSRAKRFEIFVSPELDDVVEVLATHVHELVHAAVGLDAGHGPKFRRVALALGFEGPMRETPVGDALRSRLVELARGLGPYPHGRLGFGAAKTGPAKQTTRLRKIECPECGWTARTTAKWIEVGLPTCCCGAYMMEAGGGEEGDE